MINIAYIEQEISKYCKSLLVLYHNTDNTSSVYKVVNEITDSIFTGSFTLLYDAEIERLKLDKKYKYGNFFIICPHLSDPTLNNFQDKNGSIKNCIEAIVTRIDEYKKPHSTYTIAERLVLMVFVNVMKKMVDGINARLRKQSMYI